MTDLERSICDLEKILSHYKPYLDQKHLSGAVPMPLRTVKSAFDALVLSNALYTLVKGFDVGKERSEKRIAQCEAHMPELSALDRDTVEIALKALSVIIDHYYYSQV